MSRVIVCGGRHYFNAKRLFRVLDDAHAADKITVIVHGDAGGCDGLAKQWANSRGVPHESHPANWQRYGRRAGPMRNQEMVNAGADDLIAFPGGKGTEDCSRRAERAGITVTRILHGGDDE